MKLFLFTTILLFHLQMNAQIILLNETFDNGIPTNWLVIDNDGSVPDVSVSEYLDAWIVTTDPNDNSNNVVSSTSYFTPIGQSSRWLILPEINLGASGNFISWWGKSHDPSFPDSYVVYISNAGNNIANFQDTLILIENESPEWTFHQIEIENYDSETINIAYELNTYNGFKIYLDSIQVDKENPLNIHQSWSYQNIIYPNPVKDDLNISVKNFESVQIQDLNGNELLKSVNPYNLDVSALPTGIYLLSILLKDGSILVEKMIKI